MLGPTGHLPHKAAGTRLGSVTAIPHTHKYTQGAGQNECSYQTDLEQSLYVYEMTDGH